MTRVFISHAKDDHALAGWLHRWLVGEGHEVFFDQDPDDGVTLGEGWEQRLHDELRRADAVVCVLTSAYLASRWCTAEVAIARSRGSRLLPILAEPGVADPLLTSVHYIDLVRDPGAVRPALAAALRQLATAWPDDRSPFPGLRPFEIDQHRVFFGRADDVGQLTVLLRSPAEQAKGAALLVVGPSGCGKSSLVRAGLGPVIADEPGWWTLPPILPGAHPVAVLARELATAARQCGLEWTVAHVHQRLDENGLTGLADELLLAAPGGPRRRLLVVVDQLEELLTQTDPAERTRFAELLCPALAGPVHVVATMRPEFLDELLLDPDLAFLATRTYTLRPLRREALRAVIEKPAQLAGIELDDGLVDRLVEDTDSGEALPLLAFTLAQLADGITRGGRLSSARYDQLGGVQGALTRQADAALAEAVTASGRSREEVIAGLLRLVTVDEQGRPTRWRVRRAELPMPVVTELDAFVARRLLTTGVDNGTVVIGVAHEAFLTAWPPLAQAITTSASALRARRAVEHAATEWHHNARPPARLWSGGQLATAVTDTGAHIRPGTAPATGSLPTSPQRKGPARWLRRHRMLVTDRVNLSPQARDFLHASIRRDRSRRRRATTVLSVLLIAALVAAGIAVDQQRRVQAEQRIAQEREQIATARSLVAQADNTRNTDPHTALQLGLAAHRIYPNDETYTSLVNTLTDTRYAGTLNDNTDSMHFSPRALTADGRTLATVSSDEGSASSDVIGEDEVILWDLADPTQPRQLSSLSINLNGSESSVEFVPDGRDLATFSDFHDGYGKDGEVIFWDLADPTQPSRLDLPLTSSVFSVFWAAFAHDGHTLVTHVGQGTVVLWDLRGRDYFLTHAWERACAITGGGFDQNEWASRIPGLPYQESCSA